MKFVILAGGHGKRLWPLSTKNKPKQFQSFLDDKSLLRHSFDRLDFVDPSDIFVATNQEYVELVKQQLPEIPTSNIIAEPALRDTGPCMSFATKYLESIFGPDETMSIIYADHLIKDKEEFQKKQIEGHTLAKDSHKIVIVEVKAKSPNPNLGYIQIGNKIEGTPAHELKRFTEKPDLETAKQFVESGDYLWNTGFYIWQIGTFLKYIEQFSPDISEVINKIEDFHNCKNHYESFPKISMDYALMEKIDPTNVMIIPAEIGWSDIGTWETLFEELSKNPEENLTEGEVKQLDNSGCIIINKESSKKVAVTNMQNFVVINTEDSILVCPREESQRIKDLLANMDKES